MTHAKALRVIGQSLEVARVFMFTLERDGRNYTVQSDSLSRTAEWMLRYAAGDISTPAVRSSTAESSVEIKPVQFNDSDIARLDAREAKRRRGIPSSQTDLSTNLSQLLRTLGDHLDRSSAQIFRICWLHDSVVVDYSKPDGFTDRYRLTPEKLLQLSHRFRMARASNGTANI
jgi:hypothetical protein